ncbi:hypothetical protein PV325_013776 [Microctonus aethiopoides]|nr:hypothetical protein PV325_013776 [Microctonus aethiopoides]
MLIFGWFTLDPAGSAAIATGQRPSGPLASHKCLKIFLKSQKQKSQLENFMVLLIRLTIRRQLYILRLWAYRQEDRIFTSFADRHRLLGLERLCVPALKDSANCEGSTVVFKLSVE